MEIKIDGIEDIDRAARDFAAYIRPGGHYAFTGEMGAGKTTFIAALCRALGMEDEATSPTFSIVNEYHGNGRRIFHFDFYRMESPAEALDLGLDDYFDSGDLCLMEWPGKVEEFLPDDTVEVNLRVDDSGARIISM